MTMVDDFEDRIESGYGTEHLGGVLRRLVMEVIELITAGSYDDELFSKCIETVTLKDFMESAFVAVTLGVEPDSDFGEYVPYMMKIIGAKLCEELVEGLARELAED